MFQKYRNLCDNELVFTYKKTPNDDLENEIISRYMKHSKRNAAILYSKYKFLYQVEFDDIYSILLASIFLAIERFDDTSINFYKFWKKLATNEVNIYVGEFSQEENYLIDGNKNTTQEIGAAGYFKQRLNSSYDNSLYSCELDDILDDPKNELKQEDVSMFRLYLGGYSIYDIAELTNRSYNNVRYRISIVRRKITNILFNQ